MSETLSEQVDTGIDVRHVTGLAAGAVVVSLYATWMVADIVARWLAFPVTVLVTGYLLYGREGSHEKAVFVGYALAALLAVTPVAMILPDVLWEFTENPTAMALTVSNVILFVLFLLPAAVVAYTTYRFDGGRGVVQRVRAAL